MSEYTPDTAEVRAVYVEAMVGDPNRHDGTPRVHAEADFDRWLADHDAEVVGPPVVDVDRLGKDIGHIVEDLGGMADPALITSCLVDVYGTFASLAKVKAEARALALMDAMFLVNKEAPEVGPHISMSPFREGKAAGIERAQLVLYREHKRTVEENTDG